jgi:hypothetical protein
VPVTQGRRGRGRRSRRYTPVAIDGGTTGVAGASGGVADGGTNIDGSLGSDAGSQVVASGVLGVEGGMIATPDHAVVVIVPPGAVAAPISLTIAAVPSPLSGNLGPVYEIGPTGTQFVNPATIILRYSAADLAGKSDSDVAVSTVVGAR